MSTIKESGRGCAGYSSQEVAMRRFFLTFPILNFSEYWHGFLADTP